MKYIVLSLAAASAFIGLPAQSQSPKMDRISQRSSDQFVMPQSRARRIASSLDNWTLKSGDRPKAIGISRDCMGASAKMMQNGSGPHGINQAAMPAMSFWGSVSGAAIIRARQNNNLGSQSDSKTDYQQKLSDKANKTKLSDGNVPEFVQDYYAECELLRKRFGG